MRPIQLVCPQTQGRLGIAEIRSRLAMHLVSETLESDSRIQLVWPADSGSWWGLPIMMLMRTSLMLQVLMRTSGVADVDADFRCYDSGCDRS